MHERESVFFVCGYGCVYYRHGSYKPFVSHVICMLYHIYQVGLNHKCTVYIQYFRQGNHQIYSHLRCIYIRLWPILSSHYMI